jgi:hypothetical protein
MRFTPLVPLWSLTLRLLWGNGGYRGQWVTGGSPHLRFVLRGTLRPESATGFGLLLRRWVGESTLAWLNQPHRFSKD